jgi:hypothetical protein
MIMQLLDSNHIKVKVFPNAQSANPDFDMNALVYAR